MKQGDLFGSEPAVGPQQARPERVAETRAEPAVGPQQARPERVAETRAEPAVGPQQARPERVAETRAEPAVGPQQARPERVAETRAEPAVGPQQARPERVAETRAEPAVGPQQARPERVAETRAEPAVGPQQARPERVAEIRAEPAVGPQQARPERVAETRAELAVGPQQARPERVAETRATPQQARPERVAPPEPVLLPSERTPLDPPAQPAWRRPTASTERKVVSVSELTAQVKGLLEPALTRVLVRGEVSGFRGPNARGHLYFSIKDQFASIEVRIWQSTARLLKFALRDGLSVVVEGGINVWEPQGRYAVIAARIEPEGVGARALAFDQLKQKLAAEGVIGERRTKPKRALPLLPRRIGVVTSISGAALRDFLKVLHRRHPNLAVVVCDARVQGEGAGYEVARAIRWFARVDIDVLVVTRGGGSVDDLWAFNEEPIARAIFASRVPVVSAVGHEIDTTLADLVADVRAPTPSAAAEAVAPVLSELMLHLANTQARLRRAIDRRVLHDRNGLRALGSQLVDPRRTLTQYRMQFSDSADRMARALRKQLRAKNEALRGLSLRLQRARPQDQLTVRRAALESLSSRLVAVMRSSLRRERETFSRSVMEFHRASPSPEVVRLRQALRHFADRLNAWPKRQLTREQERLRSTAGRLDALSPLRVLARGYALVQLPDGHVVRRASDVQVGQSVTITVAERDEIQATVSGVKPRE